MKTFQTNQVTVAANLATDDSEEFFELPGAEPFDLTKAQAVRHLDRRFASYVTANGLPHLVSQAPDFRTLIDENVRDEFPPSATANGVRRGNRVMYGAIPHLRQSRGKNSALFFRSTDLDSWFDARYLPAIAKRLH